MTPALAGDLQNFHRATQGMWRCTAASLFVSQTRIHYSEPAPDCQDANENHSHLNSDMDSFC